MARADTGLLKVVPASWCGSGGVRLDMGRSICPAIVGHLFSVSAKTARGKPVAAGLKTPDIQPGGAVSAG
jgi:hypothetical protein